MRTIATRTRANPRGPTAEVAQTALGKTNMSLDNT